MERFSRTERLLGTAGMARLAGASVAVVGLGGVGSYVAEALARGGIGRLTLMDADTVNESNCNRQLCALQSTIGLPKAEVVAARVRDISPACVVTPLVARYTGTELCCADFTYLADAIDAVPDKIELICAAAQAGTPILSCMGTGNKLDATQFRVADLEKTFGCPLAKVLRLALRKRGIRKVQTVFSPETPVCSMTALPDGTRLPIGSVSWVPATAGLLLAGTILQAIATDTLQPPVCCPPQESSKE